MMMILFRFLAIVTFFSSVAFGEDLLELGCLNDQQCKQFERANITARCMEGQCNCRKTDSNAEKVDCAPAEVKLGNYIGGQCPCALPKAECKKEQNICYCAQGYVASADRRRCLAENVSLNETCETDKQCHSADFYAVCDAKLKMCTCQNNFTAINGTCVSVADPATICQNDSDCSAIGSNVVCSKKYQKCICNEDHVKATHKTECLPLVAFQEKCTEDQQCLKKLGPGGACIAGSCECRDKHYVVQKQTAANGTHEKPQVQCSRIIEIGEYCYEDKDCFKQQLPEEEQTMSCFYGECNCKWGYNSINFMECVKANHGSYTSGPFWVAFAIAAIVNSL